MLINPQTKRNRLLYIFKGSGSYSLINVGILQVLTELNILNQEILRLSNEERILCVVAFAFSRAFPIINTICH